MIYLALGKSFALIGLLAVGGGMATIPFLYNLSVSTGWFSVEDLSRIIAIAESTPGPIGVNTATYVGYTVTETIWGGILATLCLTLPAFLIILCLVKVIEKLRGKAFFEGIFYGLRPASTGLIASVLLSLALSTFFVFGESFALNGKALLLFVILFVAMTIPKLAQRLPTPVYLLFAAIMGIVFQL